MFMKKIDESLKLVSTVLTADEKKAKELARLKKQGFQPGVSGNPAGRPKGVSITSSMKRKLERTAKNGKTNLHNMVTKIHKQALEGDTASQKLIWNYIDGLPEMKGKVDIDTTLNILLTNYKTDVLGQATKVKALEPETLQLEPVSEDTK